ncbi:hypothetical protein EDC01DRAFT_647235 [Geopyxis carbonaria]|nr:hypothetical protein EDC01DRAFT_647235 [Geopyxis carbonaria]
MLFCNFHWDKFQSHDPDLVSEKDASLHRQLDIDKYKPIKELLCPVELDKKELLELHGKDSHTTWFGVYGADFREAPCKGLNESEDAPPKKTLEWVQTQRISQLLSFENHWNDEQFPRLVSFVGATGSGKSFLIKSLMTLAESEKEDNCKVLDAQMPIPAASNSAGTATSFNVHMYADESTLSARYPLVYADSEGLEGGNNPTASRLITAELNAEQETNSKTKTSKRRASVPGFGHCAPISEDFFGAEKTIIKVDDPAVTREIYVDQIYPRILYSLSDVICFVTNTPNNPEIVFRKLIFWADEAVAAAVNQTVIPYAIVVLNCPTQHSPELLDPVVATKKLFYGKEQMSMTKLLKGIAAKWIKKTQKPVDTVFELLKCYFRDIIVVYIPHGRDTSIGIDVFKAQLVKLRDCIQDTSKESHINKHHNFSLLSARQFEYVSDAALRHFSSASDLPANKRKPFDILKTVASKEVMPHGFVEHLTNLMSNLDSVIKARAANGTNISLTSIKEIGTDSTEDKMLELDKTVVHVLWSAVLTHPEYTNASTERILDMCAQGYEKYYTSIHPCKSKGCVNLEWGHAKGHQSHTGDVFGPGESFVAAFQKKNQAYFVGCIREKLQKLSIDQEEILTDRHAKNILEQREYLKDAKSKRTCFMCLMAIPDCSLPCGHTLCETCIRRYGEHDEHDSHTVSFMRCPLGCDNELRPNQNSDTNAKFWWSIHLKPPTAGVRILALDGGGVRGVIASTIVSKLEDELGLGLPIHRYFDLIVGTSAGGILALALGHEGLNAADAHEKFAKFSKKVFKDGIFRRATSLIGINARYPPGPIEKCLQDLFGDAPLFCSRGPKVCVETDPADEKTIRINSSLKVAVTSTTPSGRLCVMSNYIRKGLQSYSEFYREEEDHKEIEVWRAARCTSAAPSYFPICTAPNGMPYQDGALMANCPARVASGERSLIWPELDGFDELISIGTGFTEATNQPTGRKNIVSLVHKAIARNLNSQAQWDDALQDFNKYPKKAIRLSMRLPKKVKLNDASKIDELNYRTDSDYSAVKGRQRLDNTANFITSSLFYFELTSTTSKGGHMHSRIQSWFSIKGTIRCRLHYLERKARKRLAEKLAKKKGKFAIGGAHSLTIKPPEISDHDELVYELEFSVSNLDTEIGINLNLEGSDFPISGMPRKIKELKSIGLKSPRTEHLKRVEVSSVRGFCMGKHSIANLKTTS